jgi:ATP-dependent helicase/nuclease subunit B
MGRQQSGKSYRCIEIACDLAKADKQVILLIPEQYSFECQRLLLSTLGPKLSNRIDIQSFTGLCKSISAEIGGIAGRNVDDGTRYLLVSKAVGSVADSLKHYFKYANSPKFLKEVVSVITELKQCSVSPEDLKELSLNTNSSIISDKLYDISLIMSAYNAYLGTRFLDPLDLIDRTVNLMQSGDYFNGKTVIIDEFKGFTEAQFSMLDRIISGADNVYVSLCADSEIIKNDADIFGNIKSVATILKAKATSHSVPIAETVFCERYKKDTGLYSLEKYLAGDSDFMAVSDETVSICHAASVHSEVDFVMNTVQKLIRTKGYRYRDFVIISRSADTYMPLISARAKKYNIPVFTDTSVSVSSLPLSVFVLSAINAAIGFNTDSILKYLKTGLSNLSDNDIAQIENYCFVWGINGNKWKSDWNMSPDGLKMSSKEDNKSEYINELRFKVITPILNLKQGLKGTAEDMCHAVMSLIKECDTAKVLLKYSNELDMLGRENEAEYQRTGYDVFIKVLDKICAVNGSETLTAKEFYSVLSEALSFEIVGGIPQTKDQIIYGTADKIRPMRPKVAFILGANRDVFPKNVADTGLFSKDERSLMINGGLKVSSNSVKDYIDEKFLFYYSSTVAEENVYLLYSDKTVAGSPLEPSAEIEGVMEHLIDKSQVIEHGFSDEFNALDIECEVSGFEMLAENFKKNTPDVLALKRYFAEKTDYESKISALTSVAENRSLKLSKEAASEIYGKDLRISSTKIDDFGKCPFAFFCKYGIGAKKLEKVEFSALTRGNIVHDVLDKFVAAHKEDIGFLSPEVIKQDVETLCDGYILQLGVKDTDLDERFNYLITVIKELAEYFITAINNEFAQSKFRPKECELPVGVNSPIGTVKVDIDGENSISLEGKIDRVDTTPDGKVRIIDYKTGNKIFSLSSILDGVDIQMLLYLYAVIKNGRDLLLAETPAGVLYFPASVDTKVGKTEHIKMNGLLLNDIDTVRQMESDVTGKFIPAKLTKKNSFDKRYSKVIDIEGFETIFKYLNLILADIGRRILGGDIKTLPLEVSNNTSQCDYCDYKLVCHLEDKSEFKNKSKAKIEQVMEIIKKETEGI